MEVYNCLVEGLADSSEMPDIERFFRVLGLLWPPRRLLPLSLERMTLYRRSGTYEKRILSVCHAIFHTIIPSFSDSLSLCVSVSLSVSVSLWFCLCLILFILLGYNSDECLFQRSGT